MGLMPTQNMAIFELLDHIVSNEPPKLYVEPGQFSSSFVDFVNYSLRKEMKERPTFAQLSDEAFIIDSTKVFDQDTQYFANFMTFALTKYL